MQRCLDTCIAETPGKAQEYITELLYPLRIIESVVMFIVLKNQPLREIVSFFVLQMMNSICSKIFTEDAFKHAI